jgi:type IV secretion system protein TrbL
MPSVDALSPIHLHFLVAAQHWFPALWAAANWVFNTLLIAEIVTFVIARQASSTMFFGLFIDRVFRILLFKLILINAGTLIPALINGFIEMGSRAGGVNALNPQAVAVQGLVLMTKMFWEMMDWGLLLHPMSVLAGTFCAIGVALAYLVIAFTLSLALIEMYIVTGAGVFLLGFGGWNGTSGITHRYLSYTVGVGTKLFMTYLLIGAGDVLVHLWSDMVTSITIENFSTPFAILMGVAAFGLSVWTIPSLTSSLLTGSIGMGVMESLQTTVAVSRLAVSAASGGPALLGAAGQAVGLGMEAARRAGGGFGGAMRGIGAAVGASARDFVSLGSPRISMGMRNLREQREHMEKQP